MDTLTYDYVIIGSGFGGSVSALRLTEKGYHVLVLERGKRFRDQDFAQRNWTVWKYLWFPALRWFGILQISPFRNVFVLHGSGVGGGSLGYANVLMEPDDASFDTPGWQRPIDWRAALRPHYETAKRMLGVTTNPRLWAADETLRLIARELGREDTFHPVTTGIYFGEPGVEAPDPYFDGEGPARSGCIHCGACMVGCRYNAKNTLVKNYLYLAEKWGAQVRAEAEVRDVRPLPENQPDGARYEVIYRRTTQPFFAETTRVRARSVIFSAGALGTMRLLFRCRDLTRSLPKLSPRLGDNVRTNSEALLGSTSRVFKTDYSQGIAITSIFNADDVTTVEPVRYPAGSSLMRLLAGPMTSGRNLPERFVKSVAQIALKLRSFANVQFGRHWAERTTILLVMQHEDNRIRMRLGRSPFTFLKRNLVSLPDEEKTIPTQIETGHNVARAFAAKTDGFAEGSINEGLLNIPITAHILGGVPFRRERRRGRDRRQLRGSRLSRLVRDRRLDCPGEPRRQPQPDDHGAGGVRHEPRAAQDSGRTSGAGANRDSGLMCRSAPACAPSFALGRHIGLPLRNLGGHRFQRQIVQRDHRFVQVRFLDHERDAALRRSLRNRHHVNTVIAQHGENAPGDARRAAHPRPDHRHDRDFAQHVDRFHVLPLDLFGKLRADRLDRRVDALVGQHEAEALLGRRLRDHQDVRARLRRRQKRPPGDARHADHAAPADRQQADAAHAKSPP